MATIEQKLTLFSKLLNQDIREEANEKLLALDKEYEKLMAENKFETDKQASEIVEQARKQAEIKKVERISKGRMASKKEMMLIKEELVSRFMVQLDEKVKAFTKKPAYKEYLLKVIAGLNGLKDYENDLIVYLTEEDLKENKEWIKKALCDVGIKETALSFEVATEDILGGLIIKDPVLNMRVDESIRTMIDESQEEIVEKISVAMEEAGDDNNE